MFRSTNVLRRLFVLGLLATVSHASELIYEGFGDASYEGQTLVGYSGSSAEKGLSGTWSVSPDDGQESLKVRQPGWYVGIDSGHGVDYVGSYQHFWEHNNNWTPHTAQRSLSTTINMTADGTWYMSFFSMSGTTDYLAQVGFNDGTNELIWGNGYSGSGKGLTAYYGTIGTGSTTNANGTNIWGTNWDTSLYVAKLVKTNSGSTDDLTVSIAYYDLGNPDSPSNTIPSSDPSWNRVVSLTGVSGVFNTLELKLSGGSSNWPSIDEVRVGQSWYDVTGSDPAVFKSGTVVPTDLGYTGLPWCGTLSWDTDEDAPLGSQDGGSVWGNGAFYSDVVGSAIGGGRDYTALRIDLNGLLGREVKLTEIDSISYYTNMDPEGIAVEPSTELDWQLKIYTQPLSGQSSGWYGHRFLFNRGHNPDGNWDLWDTESYTVYEVRAGADGSTASPDAVLSDLQSSYTADKILFLDIIAGYATNSPESYSYLDAVTINLTNGSEFTLDLEMQRAPVCSTHSASSITGTSATVSGAVVEPGGVPAAEFRFVYTPEGGATLSTPWTTHVGDSCKFVGIDDLTDDTLYSYQMEIRNGTGSDQGEVETFKTLKLPKVLLSSSVGGSVVDPGEGLVKLVNQGDVLDVNAVAEDGYVFSQWAGTAVTQGLVADPLSPNTSVEVYESLTLEALFNPTKIIWVTQTEDADEDGVYDDESWIDWLTSEGYVVEAIRDRYLTLGDEKDVNDANDYVGELNDAALVILSRSTSSGDYDDDPNEIAAWNSVTTPMICLTAYLPRSSRLDWIDSTTIESDNTISFMALDVSDHPIFEGVEAVDGMVDVVDPLIYGDGYDGTTFLSAESMGNGTVLGSHLYGYPWIAEWQAGVIYYEGSSQVPAGQRMMFMAGTQETRPTYPQGDLNLTDAGKQVFLNAVDYMMELNPVNPGSINLVAYYPLDGDVLDASGNGLDGTLVSDPIFVEGMVGMGLQLDGVDDYVDCGSDASFDFAEQITLATWVNVNDFGNGENDPWVSKGDHSWCIKGHRNDSAIEFFVYEDGWNWIDAEVGDINNEWHHAVGTFDGSQLKVYLDGVLIATKDYVGGIATSTDHVAIGTNTEASGRFSEGIQDEVRIYNRALTPAEIAYLVGM